MDMASIMKQAQEMQSQMKKIQQDLGQKQIDGTAGGGMVTVTVNGNGDVLDVDIEKELISPNEQEMLQDLIVAATNDALRKAKELSTQEMGHLTGGMKIPGLSNML